MQKPKKIYLKCLLAGWVLLMIAGYAHAQSTANNYILTYVPRVPVSNAATLPGSAIGNVNQTVQYFDGLGRPIQTVQT